MRNRIIAIIASVFAIAAFTAGSASAGVHPHGRPAGPLPVTTTWAQGHAGAVPRAAHLGASPAVDNNFGPFAWCAALENSLCWHNNGLQNQATIQTGNYWQATLIATSTPGDYYIQNAGGNCMDEHDNTGMYLGNCTNGDGRQVFTLENNGGGNYNFQNFTTGDFIITTRNQNGAGLWGGEMVSGNHYNWDYCSNSCS